MLKRKTQEEPTPLLLLRVIKSKGATTATVVFLVSLNLIWTVSNMYMALNHLESASDTDIGHPPTSPLLRRIPMKQPGSVDTTTTDILPKSASSSSSSSSSSSLPASVWTTRQLQMLGDENGDDDDDDAEAKREDLRRTIRSGLREEEIDRLYRLCGKFVYSSITSGAIEMKPDGTTFVATGDIDDMWTRDSSVQISLLYHRQNPETAAANLATNFRAVLEGTLRRNAFYIVQDPYANAYESTYKHPVADWPSLKDRVIGRGGWVATRNYELDSGAYFLNQLWDYYAMDPRAATRLFGHDAFILDAVRVLVDVWTLERHHETRSEYRYFELDREGLGGPTAYTGMTWTGFRPSDEPCTHHYLVPANIHAAAGLERMVALNEAVWRDPVLGARTASLLASLEQGINDHGIVRAEDGTRIYAYEVDGMGNALVDYDDANVPSLLSVPLLGWSGTDRAVYEATRERILSAEHNRYYYEGTAATGIGSSHTPVGNVWPMALAVQALTSNDAGEIVGKLRELLGVAACRDAMHESVHKDRGCRQRTRDWFEWANALFVVLVESALGEGHRCDAAGQDLVRSRLLLNHPEKNAAKRRANFYSNRYRNNATDPHHYQGIQSFIVHNDRHQPSGTGSRIGLA